MESSAYRWGITVLLGYYIFIFLKHSGVWAQITTKPRQKINRLTDQDCSQLETKKDLAFIFDLLTEDVHKIEFVVIYHIYGSHEG